MKEHVTQCTIMELYGTEVLVFLWNLLEMKNIEYH